MADRSKIEDIDPEVMAHYKEELGTNASDEQVLHSRSMLVGGHLANTGVLPFTKNPPSLSPARG